MLHRIDQYQPNICFLVLLRILHHFYLSLLLVFLFFIFNLYFFVLFLCFLSWFPFLAWLFSLSDFVAVFGCTLYICFFVFFGASFLPIFIFSYRASFLLFYFFFSYFDTSLFLCSCTILVHFPFFHILCVAFCALFLICSSFLFIYFYPWFVYLSHRSCKMQSV